MSDSHDKITTTFEALKSAGLEAKNPDQSAAMYAGFTDAVFTCRWKGFSEEDIDLMFTEAKKALRPKP